MMDPLRIATIATAISAASREEILNATEVAASNFVAAGGVVSLTEWAALSEESRAALVAARNRYELEKAGTLAVLLRRALTAQEAPSGADPVEPTQHMTAAEQARARVAAALERHARGDA